MATRVQALAIQESNGSPTTLSFPSTSLTAGNLLTITVITQAAGSFGIPTAADTTHTVSAVQAYTVTATSTNTRTTVLYITNLTGGATVITVTLPTTRGNTVVAIAQEWSGVITSSPNDKNATNTAAASTSHSTGTTATTTSANEFCFVADSHNGAAGAPSAMSNGYTLLRGTTNEYDDSITFFPTMTGFGEQTSIQTQTTTITWTSAVYATGVATFIEVAGAASDIPVPLAGIRFNTLIRL
jgi:hypothetical protein